MALAIKGAAAPASDREAFLEELIVRRELTVPKTSSRAITSPAGTADAMEVLAEVSLSTERILEVTKSVGTCIAWGGALDLASADDVLITV